MSGGDERGNLLNLPASAEEQQAIDRAREVLVVAPEQIDELRERLDGIGHDAVRRARSARQVGVAVRGALAVAAAVTLALLVGRWATTPEDHPAEPVVQMVVETGPHQVQSVSPAAGIDVAVAASSTVAVVADHEREVVLTLDHGEVAVDYGHDAAVRELRVEAGDVTVVVTGTRFTVARRDGRTRVDVDRGSVLVRWPDGEVALAQGGSWRSPAGEEPLVTAAAQPVMASQDPGLADVAMATPAVAAAEPSAPITEHTIAETMHVELPQLADAPSEAELLLRIMTTRTSLAPEAQLTDLEQFVQRFPDSVNGDLVASYRVDALARTGDDAAALAAAAQFLDCHPTSSSRADVRWIEATVARDRMHDCTRALPAYRELAAAGGARAGEAGFYRGVCAAQQGNDAEARGALEAAISAGLEPQLQAEARELLQGL